MSNCVVVAEKPSVGMEIAGVLGCRQRGEGYVAGNGYVVTWARGHLVGLAQPQEMKSEWKSWTPQVLPMIPQSWPLSVLNDGDSEKQFKTVAKWLNDTNTSEVVCATDAGREGELIFRLIYEAAGCSKPVRRLWISSLTAEAIRNGFEALKPAREYDALAAAARSRAQADWLVGMNLTRLYTLALRSEGDGETVVSVGRVQTPTLAMIVERDLAIERFVPEVYGEVEATFVCSTSARARYTGKLIRADAWQGLEAGTDGAEESDEAETEARSMFRVPADFQLDARWTGAEAVIDKAVEERRKEAPPLLFDLTELQRTANRVYGFSASETLELAQALYEKKALSYPRTDSRYLSADVAKTLGGIVRALSKSYGALVAPGTLERPIPSRFVNDAKVSDHHAIIPTTRPIDMGELAAGEARVYDLVCRRLLGCWYADAVTAVTTIVTRTPVTRDLWLSKGIVAIAAGWKDVEVRPASKKGPAEKEPEALPIGLEVGGRSRLEDVNLRKKKTRASARFTEASLLTGMESAGKTVSEKELSDAMKERGLGTPATRAAMIETLIKRGYVARQGKALVSTVRGREVIERINADVKSAALTGEWEAFLKRVERGRADAAVFLGAIERFVAEVVQSVKAAKRAGAMRELSAGGAVVPPKARKGTAKRSGRGAR